MNNQSQVSLKQSWPARMMRIGGIMNIVFSPILAFLYLWLEPLEGRPVPADPFFLVILLLTTVFGALYYRIGSAPERNASLIPVAIGAKTWGIFAIGYALVTGYGSVPLAGLYDLIFLPFLIILHLRVRAVARVAEEPIHAAKQNAPRGAPRVVRL